MNYNKNLFLKKVFLCVLMSVTLLLLLPLGGNDSKKKESPNIVNDKDGKLTGKPSASDTPSSDEETTTSNVFSYYNNDGSTMESRINVPTGFARVPSDQKELTTFLRNLKLKPSGSKVMLYNGEEKGNQDAQAAVFALPIGNKNLQQCADSAIRIYAEYYWSIGAYDKISFHLTNGFLMEYTKWRSGYRLKVSGNNVSWNKSTSYDDSYEQFRNYLNQVFNYAGTLSLSKECSPIAIKDIQPGDLFLKGGSPGHCVVVVDEAIDKNGEHCFLLAQGYMPAQDFHILKNPLHPENPWYYEKEITFPLSTPQYGFYEGSLVRWRDFSINKSGVTLDPSSFSENTDNVTGAVPVVSTNVISTTKKSSSVTLLAVGDNLIHIQIIDSGKKKNGTYNYDHLYSRLAKEVSAADIAVINQETILGGKDFPYTGYPSFNSPTEIGDAVIKAGFDVVLQASNHTFDKGVKAVENTLAYWKKHPKITVLGINSSQKERDQIDIVEKNGIKIAMLNYTFGLNGGKTAPKNKSYLVNIIDKKKMAADIKKAESLADFTIVFPHWGTEYTYNPTKTQKDLAQFFYNNGVDLVIGAHPHVIEPVQWIKSKPNHSMLVYYSLGNFISYQREAPRMLGGMAKITLTKDSSGTHITNSSITPIVTHYENGPANFNYALYKLKDYNETLAKRHGVSELAKQGALSYKKLCDLAKQVLGTWYQP